MRSLSSLVCLIFLLPLNPALSSDSELSSEDRHDDFIVIAHRGAAGYAPENTIPSIEKAIGLGANYIEIDVHQSKDKEVVVIHDYSVDRTTDGSGKVVEMTLEELKALDAGSWYDSSFSGTQIPTLDEAIDILPESTKLIIELKGDEDKYPGFVESIIKIVRDRGVGEQVVLKSFNTNQLELCRKLAPEIERLYVFVLHASWLNFTIGTSPSFTDILEENPSEAAFYQAHRWFLTKSFVEKVQKKGIRLIAWHVHEHKDIKAVLELGVDGIETDYPDRVIKLMQR